MALPSPSPDQVSRFRQDFASLAGGEPERLAVALSGGPDSLALLLLAAAAFTGRVAAATVDHGLRPASAGEAAFAARASAAVAVPHTILRVDVARGASVQAAARRARYTALTEWAQVQGCTTLATGHHADDQAETVLMRLLRGSGVRGLAGIRSRARLAEGLLLCRPLLLWRRSELAEIVHGAGFDAVDDPSNRDNAYDRVRMRQRLTEATWLDPAAIARSASALGEADEALSQAADLLFRERVAAGDGWAELRPDGVPEALLRLLVERTLALVAAGKGPRGEQLSAVIATLRSNGTCNVAGVLCRGGAKWRFAPEPPRRR